MYCHLTGGNCRRSPMPTHTDIPTRKASPGIISLLLRYRDFLLDPGTLFTIASAFLLVAATILHPAGLFSENGMSGNGRFLYLAAALVGSSYIWWSAIQGIRESDFTADIPVSIATIAAIAIGQYSGRRRRSGPVTARAACWRTSWPPGRAKRWRRWPGSCPTG